MELHREEKREGDQEDQEETVGRVAKRRETDLASNQVCKCSSQSRTHKQIHKLGREEKGEGGDRGDLGEKKESQKGERVIKPVITVLSKNEY